MIQTCRPPRPLMILYNAIFLPRKSANFKFRENCWPPKKNDDFCDNHVHALSFLCRGLYDQRKLENTE